MKYLAILVVLTCASFAGCATQPSLLVPLNQQHIGHTYSATVVLTTHQDIKTNSSGSNISGSLGGGVLLSLVDLSVTGFRDQQAKQITQVLRSKWISYDLSGRLKQLINDPLKTVTWLDINDIRDGLVTNGVVVSEKSCGAIISDTCVSINTESYFDQGYNSITLKSVIDVYVKGADNQFSRDPIYKNTVFSVYMLPDHVLPNDRIMAWSDGQYQHLKTSFEQGADEVVRRLMAGLTDPSRQGWKN